MDCNIDVFKTNASINFQIVLKKINISFTVNDNTQRNNVLIQFPIIFD